MHERAASVEELEGLRDGLERFPFHAAAKHALRRRGVSVGAAVRAPLRHLTEDEERRLDDWLDSLSYSSALNPS